MDRKNNKTNSEKTFAQGMAGNDSVIYTSGSTGGSGYSSGKIPGTATGRSSAEAFESGRKESIPTDIFSSSRKHSDGAQNDDGRPAEEIYSRSRERINSPYYAPENQRKNVGRSNMDYGDDYDDDILPIFDNPPPQHQGKPPVKPKRRKKSSAKRFFKAVLTIIIVLALLLTGFGIIVLLRINYSDDHPDTQMIEDEIGELKSSTDVTNILLFGVDNHPANENGRSDSVILLSFDRKHRTIKQTSFLRDLYVHIPGHGEDRLNAAFSTGGASLAAETIEYNFGIKIDNYASIDFSGFTSVIDAMGGIDLELTAEEIDYINWQCWKNKQVDTRHELSIDNLYFHDNEDGYSTASVHLNGRQSLWYARNRDSAGSDFDRTARQRIVIDTVLSKIKSADPITLMNTLYQGAPYITTDMSHAGVIRNGLGMASYLRFDRKEYRVPRSDNFYDTWAGESQVLAIDDIDYEKQKLYDFVFGE